MINEPFLENKKSIRLKLNGYSGYQVYLKSNSNEEYTVIKKSSEKRTNERLQKQYEKHTFFYNLDGKPFCVPEIVNSGYENGLFFYEYKFVEGISLIKKIEMSNQEEVIKLCDDILKIIYYFKSRKDFYYEKNVSGNLKQYIQEKIDRNTAACGIDRDINKALLKNLDNFEEEGRYLCHGDFTLDNIIVDTYGKIWLIDYLDIFPHYWLDLSKLFQDIDGNWFEIKHNIKLPKNKLLFIHKYLIENINKRDPAYIKYHNFLVAIAFLRILPYARNLNDKTILINKIKYFITNTIV